MEGKRKGNRVKKVNNMGKKKKKLSFFSVIIKSLILLSFIAVSGLVYLLFFVNKAPIKKEESVKKTTVKKTLLVNKTVKEEPKEKLTEEAKQEAEVEPEAVETEVIQEPVVLQESFVNTDTEEEQEEVKEEKVFKKNSKFKKTKAAHFYEFPYQADIFSTMESPVSPGDRGTAWEYEAPVMISSNAGESYVLRVADSQVKGESLHIRSYREAQNWVTQKLTWKIAPHWRSAKYNVRLYYSAGEAEDGQQFDVSVGAQRFTGEIENNNNKLSSTIVGQVNIRKGEAYTVSIEGKVEEDGRSSGSATTFDNFNTSLAQWKVRGDAFDKQTVKKAYEGQGSVDGYDGGFINSFKGGNKTTGHMLSKKFTINKKYITFKIAGGSHKGQTAVQLIVDGEVVKEANGYDNTNLSQRTWNVAKYINKAAQIKIIDIHSAAHILVDDIAFSNSRSRSNPHSVTAKLAMMVLEPAQTAHRYYDINTKTWTRKPLPEFSAMDTVVKPSILENKNHKSGLAIFTTEALKGRLTKLKDFVKHKRNRGFKVLVVTEKHFGGGKGPKASDNIRKWLHENYKKHNIKFAIMMGNPKPMKGDIPMAIPNNSEYQQVLNNPNSLDKDFHPETPTDLFYCDVSNANWRSGVNPNGADGRIDVFVGRIHYYGEESKHSKATDIDAILQKIINYESATPEQVAKRYFFQDELVPSHIFEYAGIPYVTRRTNRWVPADHDHWFNNGFLDKFPIGMIRSGGHASPVWIESNVSSGWFASREKDADYQHHFHVFGGCDCTQPEHPENMGYMSLRYAAIGNVGASRSISSVGAGGREVAPYTDIDERRLIFYYGYSLGEAAWARNTANRVTTNGGGLMWYLSGDPSVVPFPRKLYPEKTAVVRPVSRIKFSSRADFKRKPQRITQEYDIQNLSGKTQKWMVKSSHSWLSFDVSKGISKKNEIITVTASLTKHALRLPVGLHKANLTFRIGKQVINRGFEYEVYAPLSLQNAASVQTVLNIREDQDVTQEKTLIFDLEPQKDSKVSVLFDNFENGFSKWEQVPIKNKDTGETYTTDAIGIHNGRLIRKSDKGQAGGFVKSKSFKIEQDYILFEAFDGIVPGSWEREKKFYKKFDYGFFLVVEGKRVYRTGKYIYPEEMNTPVLWDVRQWKGKEAHFEFPFFIPWRQFAVDNITFTDQPSSILSMRKGTYPLFISDYFTLRVNTDNNLVLSTPWAGETVSKSKLNFKKKNRIALTFDYRRGAIKVFHNGKFTMGVKTEGNIVPISYEKAFKNLPYEVSNFRYYNYTMSNSEIETDIRKRTALANPQPAVDEITALVVPTLSWVDFEGNRSKSYEILIDKDRDKVIKGSGVRHRYRNIPEAQFTLSTPLEANKNYYWKVITKDKKGKDFASDVWRFKTNFGRPLLSDTSFDRSSKWVSMSSLDSVDLNGQYNVNPGNGGQLAQQIRMGSSPGDTFEVRTTFDSARHQHVNYQLVAIDRRGNREIIGSHNLRHWHGAKNITSKFRFKMDRRPKNGEKVYFTAAHAGGGNHTTIHDLELIGPIVDTTKKNIAPRFSRKHFGLIAHKAGDSTYEFQFRPQVRDEAPKTLKFTMTDGPGWLTVHSTGRVFAPHGAPQSEIGKTITFKVQVTDEKGLTAEATASFKVKN